MTIEYYSCTDIEENIVFKYDSISFCCFPNRDIESNLGVDESDIDKFVKFKEAIRAKNHTDNVFHSCKSCGYFCKKKWPTTNYNFNNLIIFNVYACHLLCNYCFRAYPDYQEPSPVQKYKLYNKIKYLVDNKHLSPLAGIDWSGGEPTLNQEFDDIVRLFNDYGTFVQRFATNGIVLSPSIIETLKLGRSGIVCSVDAGTAETYKLIKGKDYFDRVWFNLKEYTKTNGDVRVKYIILNENINEIFQFINKVQEAGIDKIIYSINGMQACDAKYVDKVIRAIVELVDECDKRNIIVTAAPIIDCFSNVKSRIDSALIEG